MERKMAETDREDTSIEIRDLEELAKKATSSVQGKLCKKSPWPLVRSIFRVPKVLRKHNENAYLPDIVSIGPFHHGKESLEAMEEVKHWYLDALLSRLKSSQVSTSLESLMTSTALFEEDARECYAERVNHSHEEFLEMMVVDGCFIIELFRKREFEGLRDKDDSIFNMSWMIPNLGHDLMLLENQLPWFVLEHLFNQTKDSDAQPSLAKLAVSFFGFMMPMTVEATPSSLIINKHLLDLLRNCIVATSTSPSLPAQNTKLDLIPCAIHLLDAGVNFQVSTADNILDIKFSDGVMTIPPLRIHELTGSVFRNIIAYEQCDCQCTGRITSYAVLLSRLIDSSKDVDLLCREKILENWLSPEDVSLLFNRLYNDAGVYHFCYDQLCKEVNDYYHTDWPKWRATLKRDYFSTPWTVLSFAAAVVLLLLTFIQTLFAVL
ncbi:hypothetical protein HHK36_015790 [Tetracentron sinense]|uniref:Uncharacterized protein n=1 Tax=Tetracentron sinense TaxID=13715 RepID=A0A834Z3R0_TETSI|nr:hypothetical protein HHK36_015790 [Tetracentron sinense]